MDISTVWPKSHIHTWIYSWIYPCVDMRLRPDCGYIHGKPAYNIANLIFEVFALEVLDSEGSTLMHNYVKTNECRPTLSAAKM